MSQVVKSREDELLELQNVKTELQTLNSNGSKETKQDDIITNLQSIETNTAGLGQGTTGAESSVARTNVSTTLLAANANRVKAIIRNDTNGVMYVSETGTATITSAIKLDKGDTYISTDYTGIITGIWESTGTGNAQILEVTK